MSNDADWADPTWVLAVMHFPHDADARRCYRDLRSMQRIKPGAFVTIDSETGRRLARAAIDGFGSRIKDAARRGIVVGEFLCTMYAMHSFPKHFAEPSVRKAIHCVQSLARQVPCADGEPISHSDQAIREYIKELRNVAHLWAALRLLRTFPIKPNRELLKTAEGVSVFLAVARTLEKFGCEFQQARTKSQQPLLNANTLWHVPESVGRLTPPWTEPPKWLVETMSSYRARVSRGVQP